MSLGRIYSVWCDVNGPGCERWTGEDDSSQGARRWARRAGWKRLPGLNPRTASGLGDACPSCAARLAAEAGERA